MKKDEYFFTYPEFNNIREIMLDALNKYSNETAFILKDKDKNLYNVSYEEFFYEVKKFSTALFNLEIGRESCRERVYVLL